MCVCGGGGAGVFWAEINISVGKMGEINKQSQGAYPEVKKIKLSISLVK